MFVFSNLATSLDGKIAAKGREHFPLGTPYDRQIMQKLRAKADVVLFGASTLRTFQKPCILTKPPKKGGQPANAIVSSRLEGLDPAWPFFTRTGFRRILFCSESASPERRAAFAPSCEVIALKNPGSAREILAALQARGLKRVLVEGGGGLMWVFVRENLIDEYHVTLTPKVVGGVDAPTLVDGEGFAPAQILTLKLAGCRRKGQELYLTYRARR